MPAHLSAHFFTLRMKNTLGYFTFVLFIVLFQHSTLRADSSDYVFDKNILYHKEKADEIDSDTLIQSSCRLDIYSPKNKTDKPTIIYFHGGGLTTGRRYLPMNFVTKEYNIVCADYRLSPASKCPTYLEDCAEVVAWTFNHIQEYGGDPHKIYLSGYSSGAYLATMILLDKRYLKKYDIDADSIAGLFSYSGQMTTHFAICNERGQQVGTDSKLVDEFAPLYHARKTIRPIYFFIGDSALDMPGRYVQNKLMVEKLQTRGNNQVYFVQLKNEKHSTLETPAIDSTLIFIRRTPLSINSSTIPKLSASPNPIKNGVFKINTDNKILHLNIYNEAGQLTKSFSDSTNHIFDVHNLRKGTYIIDIKTETNCIRQKIYIP